jgi:hypothetical protein
VVAGLFAAGSSTATGEPSGALALLHVLT